MPLTLHHEIDTDSPVVMAAYELMKEAHGRQTRGKIDGSILYIVHPMMVHDLLRLMGEEDEITLAAALLHDVLEDCTQYEKEPKALEYNLAHSLEVRDVDDAYGIAARIYNICTTLKNKDHSAEGRRLMQVDEASGLTLQGAKIKLLDQTASVLDHILMEDGYGEGPFRKREWRKKSMDVVNTIVAQHPELVAWGNLHRVLSSYDMKILDATTPEEKAALRDKFDFERMLEAAKNTAQPKRRSSSEHHRQRITEACHHPNPLMVDKGIMSVELDARGRVAGYCCSSDVGDWELTKPMRDLMKRLEAPENANVERTVTSLPPRQEGGNRLRHFTVQPSVKVEDFIRIAEDAKALEEFLRISS